MGAKKGGKKAASVANNAQDFYDHTFLGNDEEMMFLRARLDSFSKNSKLGSVWPFNEEEESPCTPEKMAEAGFYYCGTDTDFDLTRCYYCRRELSGWEATDIPWDEHSRRSCPYMTLNKKPTQLTVDDQIKLEVERGKSLMRMLYNKTSLTEVEDTVAQIRQELDIVGTETKKPARKGRKRK